MGKSNHFRRNYLTVAQQSYFMRAEFPDFRPVTNRGNWISWTGPLTPSPLSTTYTVQISYEVPTRPEITILSPALTPRPDFKKIPHVFAGNKPCVHQAHEWSGDSILAHTIVPWLSAWLYFYEVWYFTGLWLGEGTHPDLPQHRSAS